MWFHGIREELGLTIVTSLFCTLLRGCSNRSLKMLQVFAWLKARADGRKVHKVHWAVKDEQKSATSTQAKHNPFRLKERNETFVTIHLQEHLHLPLLPVSGIKYQIKVSTMNFIRTVIESDFRASAWKLASHFFLIFHADAIICIVDGDTRCVKSLLTLISVAKQE